MSANEVMLYSRKTAPALGTDVSVAAGLLSTGKPYCMIAS
jgi:hypothetical protein